MLRRPSAGLIRQARELAASDNDKLAAVLGIEAVDLADSGRYREAIDTFGRSIALAQ